jgi:HK97 family phage portal protein
VANIFQRIFGIEPEQRSNDIIIYPQRTSEATSVSVAEALRITSVYRSIQIIATPIADMGMTACRYSSTTETKIPLPLIVDKPSLNQTRRNFVFETVVSLATYGEAFWLKQYDSRGNVNSVDILPAQSVGVYVDPHTFVKSFSWFGNKYSTSEIEHIKLFSMTGYPRGLGPIQQCNEELASAVQLRNWATNWFSAAGVPTGTLTTNMQLNAEQAQDIAERWHAKQASRQVAVLGSGVQYQQVSLSPKDALFTDVAAQSVQSVARLFGIPARLLVTGVDGTSLTYANLSDEERTFWRHTLSAYTDPIEDAFSNLLPRNVEVDFDFEDLFKSDMTTRYANYAVAIQAGFMTPEIVMQKEDIQNVTNIGTGDTSV